MSAQPIQDKNVEICIKEIAAHCLTFKGGDTKRSIFQLVTTLLLFTATCILMFFSLSISYWITLALTLPAAGFMTRLFIFQHDCGHGSFFNSKAANTWVGRFLGVLTFTPYDYWRRAHNMHHATSGDLNRRSVGGIDTITKAEYEALSKKKQFFYRLYRNPAILLLIGTPYHVIIAQRFAQEQRTPFHDGYQSLPPSSIRKSINSTNIALIIFYGALSYMIGFGALMAIYLPTLILTTWLGGWLFYIQHQFEETYWEDNKDWDKQESALMGSSYYALPKIIQWFTGNIGLHHIHHLCSQIPNYKLQECMDARPELARINRLGFIDSIKCIKLKLWDEEKNKLVGF